MEQLHPEIKADTATFKHTTGDDNSKQTQDLLEERKDAEVEN